MKLQKAQFENIIKEELLKIIKENDKYGRVEYDKDLLSEYFEYILEEIEKLEKRNIMIEKKISSVSVISEALLGRVTRLENKAVKDKKALELEDTLLPDYKTKPIKPMKREKPTREL